MVTTQNCVRSLESKINLQKGFIYFFGHANIDFSFR